MMGTSKPTTADAYQLLQDGALALAEVEAAGMRIDVPLLDRTIRETAAQIERLCGELRGSDVWRTWKRRFGERASLGSRPQLGRVLFDEMGYQSDRKTGTGRDQVDEESLAGIDHPFVGTWLEVERLKKLRGTSLMGVRSEVVGELLHPSFNLHLVRTYRSSCDAPNVQNVPIRDSDSGRMIRSCFVPRDGHVLVEADYSALEFKVAACHWRDENMVRYASDPALDIHRDMAAECYLLPVGEVEKKTRFFAKNQFVFPTLYGSYYANTAKSLWGVIGQHGLTVGDVGLYDHLLDRGIPSQREYEGHVRGVERAFNERFPEWSRKKERWLELYHQRGWFRTMTGFVCSGVYSRNEAYNYPIQGPAFHVLLWSLILVVREIRRRRLRSRVIAQVHDSLISDVHRDELADYVAMIREVMTERVREHWPWIVTPLGVEVDVAETNWYEKKTYEEAVA